MNKWAYVIEPIRAWVDRSAGRNRSIPVASERSGPWFANRLALAATIAAGCVCYGLTFRRGVSLPTVGYGEVAAERVLNGEVPYRDFFFNYTPGVLWLNTLAMMLFGPRMLAMRGVIALFRLATTIAGCQIGSRVLSTGWTLIAVTLMLAWSASIFTVHPTEYSMLFVMMTMASLLRFDESRGLFNLFAAGLWVGLIFTFKHNVGLAMLLACGCAIALRARFLEAERESSAPRSQLALIFIGFVTVVAPMAAYLATHKALGPMLHHFIHHAAEFGASRAVGPPMPENPPMLAAGLLIAGIVGWGINQRSHSLFLAYVITVTLSAICAVVWAGRGSGPMQSAVAIAAFLPLIAFGAVILIIKGLLRIQRNDKGAYEGLARHGRRLAIVACVAVGAYMELVPQADVYHLVRVLPPLFLLVTLLLSGLENHLFAAGVPRDDLRLLATALRIPIVALLVCVGIEITWLPRFQHGPRLDQSRPVSLDRMKGILVSEDEAAQIDSIKTLVAENTGVADSVFAFDRPGSALYFLTGRRNPTRFLWWESVGIEAVDRQFVLDLIDRGEIDAIVISDGISATHIRARLARRYHLAASSSNFDLYKPIR